VGSKDVREGRIFKLLILSPEDHNLGRINLHTPGLEGHLELLVETKLLRNGEINDRPGVGVDLVPFHVPVHLIGRLLTEEFVDVLIVEGGRGHIVGRFGELSHHFTFIFGNIESLDRLQSLL